VLSANESPELATAASHALSLIHTAQARDALAASPLLRSNQPALQLRALWDLGAHPAPYPPATVQLLQGLAQSANAQVKAQAAALLQKK
jgi:hypothetical protein